MSKTEVIEKMRKDGYPYKIKGNGGYPGGVCCHGLEEIKNSFEIIEK